MAYRYFGGEATGALGFGSLDEDASSERDQGNSCDMR